jgi:hypothetical protein
MNHPPPRISSRKTVQLMVILTILAWATQTLFHQWGYGALTEQDAAGPPTMVEIKEEAVVSSGVVKLKDVARWSARDAGAAGFSEITVATLQTPELAKDINVNRIRQALRLAGVKLTDVKLAGASACRVMRDANNGSDAPLTHPPALAEATPAIASASQPAITATAGDFVTVDFNVNAVKVQTVLKVVHAGTGTVRAKNEATGVEYSVKLTSATEGICLPDQPTAK